MLTLATNDYKIKLTTKKGELVFAETDPEVIELFLIDLAQGPAGPPGVDGDKHYRHVQASASTTWDITHNLGKNPSTTVVDSSGTQVEGMIQHISLSRVIITFSAAFAGEAFLN